MVSFFQKLIKWIYPEPFLAEPIFQYEESQSNYSTQGYTNNARKEGAWKRDIYNKRWKVDE
jgi:hypothetical protein